MMFDEVTTVNLLYDFYGNLLTKRQGQVMKLYYEENLSLSEIAEEFEISRQAVHDALKNAEKALNGYEEKLGIIKKFEETQKAVLKIDSIINQMAKDEKMPDEFKEKILEVKEIIDNIND